MNTQFLNYKAFKNWKPSVFELTEENSTIEYYNSIFSEEKEGLYFPTSSIPYVFQGIEELDLEQCKDLGIKVFDLGYTGGTLVGEEEDLPFLIAVPKEVSMTNNNCLEAIKHILSKYFLVTSLIIHNNDILLKSKKVFGGFSQSTENMFYFGGQFSFKEHEEAISKLCNKPTDKVPGHINPEYLLKSQLKEDLIAWIVNKKVSRGGI
jgi:lipoate-protein ligase A